MFILSHEGGQASLFRMDVATLNSCERRWVNRSLPSISKVVSSAVHDDILHRVDLIESAKLPRRLPILPGADEPWESEEITDHTANPNAWEMESLDQALCEMERASKKGKIAKSVCFKLISAM